MKNNIDTHLDRLTKKVMKETSLESPSLTFTDSIMSQVETLASRDVTVYKPLISKSVGTLITIGIIALISYLFFMNSSIQTEALFTLNFEALFNNRFTTVLSNIKLSETLMYAVISLGIMLFIQIPLLKNYFDKRLAV